MAIHRVFSDAEGESHIEDLNLAERPELGPLINVSEVRVGTKGSARHPVSILPKQPGSFRPSRPTSPKGQRLRAGVGRRPDSKGCVTNG